MTTFQELTENRHRLQEFCKLHYPSVEHFSAKLSFAVHRDEIDSKIIGADQVRHLTSTATCYTSLLECPERFRPHDARDIIPPAKNYALAALKRPPDKWKSDDSAPIYCRCRTLPFVVGRITEWDTCIADHIRAILKQMDQPERFAIGEADPALEASEWYRPNAYHTYWALELLDLIHTKFETHYAQLDVDSIITKKLGQMNQWARE